MTETEPIFYRDSRDGISARIYSSLELDRRLEGKLWKSEDVRVANDVQLPNSGIAEYIPVILPSDLGPFGGLPLETLGYAQCSTRSRYEQVGIDVLFNAGMDITETLKDGKDRAAFVLVKNHSPRPVKLPKGTRLFRMYLEHKAVIEGKKLLDLIKKGEIAVSGERGRDWDIAFDRITRLTEDGMLELPGVDIFGRVHGTSGSLAYPGDEGALGIWLRLDPDKRMWVSLDPDNVPIEIPDDPGIDYRAIVDSYLEPVTVWGKSVHWIGETVSKVNLSPTVAALVDRTPLRSESDFARGYLHTNSLLLDGGSPEWPIRTEIVSPTVPEKIPGYILLRFLNDRRDQPQK